MGVQIAADTYDYNATLDETRILKPAEPKRVGFAA